LLRQSKARFLFFRPCSDRAKPVFFFLRLAPTEQSSFSFFYDLLRRSKARFLFFTTCSDGAKPVFFFQTAAHGLQTRTSGNNIK
jgi:hypothetical protein